MLNIGPKDNLYLIELISPKWKTAANLLGLRISHTQVIEKNHSQNVFDCCQKVMEEWLSDKNGVYKYSPSWEGLHRLLKDLKLSTAAEHIKNTVLCDSRMQTS